MIVKLYMFTLRICWIYLQFANVFFKSWHINLRAYCGSAAFFHPLVSMNGLVSHFCCINVLPESKQQHVGMSQNDSKTHFITPRSIALEMYISSFTLPQCAGIRKTNLQTKAIGIFREFLGVFTLQLPTASPFTKTRQICVGTKKQKQNGTFKREGILRESSCFCGNPAHNHWYIKKT